LVVGLTCPPHAPPTESGRCENTGWRQPSQGARVPAGRAVRVVLAAGSGQRMCRVLARLANRATQGHCVPTEQDDVLHGVRATCILLTGPPGTAPVEWTVLATRS
jgi:hypothetical protein